MKKILLALAMITAFIACNDPKDPPDENFLKAIIAEQSKKDSLDKLYSFTPNNKQ